MVHRGGVVKGRAANADYVYIVEDLEGKKEKSYLRCTRSRRTLKFHRQGGYALLGEEKQKAKMIQQNPHSRRHSRSSKD